MIYVALAALVVAAFAVLAAAPALRTQQHAHAREQQAWAAERMKLISAMAHMNGRPLPSATPPGEPVQTPRSYVVSPEQVPTF